VSSLRERLQGRLLRLSTASAAIVLAVVALDRGTAQAPTPFASRIASLSEQGGYFDTDNLISNERSYLQVLPDLRRENIRGGAYIGVGPDTNFSYLAAVRPEIAFILDIRRDNLLLHLLFKALFELSATRIDYLSHLLGRPVPPAGNRLQDAPIDRLVTYFDRAPLDAAARRALRARIEASITRTGVPVSPEDLATIARFHQRFIEAGLDLRFNSTGRPPRADYPTYRDLLLETDAAGQPGSYLASEESFQFLKTLQSRHLVIPVIGDLAGPSAMTAIGKLLASRNERLSVFYTSNVEFYLYGDGTFPRFITNLRQIPRTKNSVIIRAVFSRYMPSRRPGDGSSTQLHRIEDLVFGAAHGKFRSYADIARREH
jgi:hypothetical protein